MKRPARSSGEDSGAVEGEERMGGLLGFVAKVGSAEAVARDVRERERARRVGEGLNGRFGGTEVVEECFSLRVGKGSLPLPDFFISVRRDGFSEVFLG